MVEGLAFEPSSIPPVYGDIPLVSMDIAYGRYLKPGEVLNFDYEAYQAGADKIAARPVSLSGLRVRLTSQLTTPGVYTHDTQGDFREISIRAKLNNPAQPSTQRTLLHETKHFIDEQNGDLYNGNRKVYNIATKMFQRKRSIGYAALCSTAILMAPLGGEAVDSDNPIIESIANFTHDLNTGWAVIAATPLFVAIAARSRYYFDPTEMAARKAEGIKTAKIITKS